MQDLFTTIIAFIKAAEAVYPENGKGKEKFQMVADQIMAFGPLIGLSIDLVTKMMPVFQAFSTAVVARFNASGAFKTTQPAAPAAPAPAK